MKIIEVGSLSELCIWWREITIFFALQFVLVFVTLLVHRRGGDGASYVFFGTAGISMQKVGTCAYSVKKKNYPTVL